MKKKHKLFWEMNTAELAESTKEFDAPMGRLPGKTLTAKDRAIHRRARQKVGRPLIGKGAKRVLISVEQDLLAKADAYAKKHRLNRSQLIAAGLKRIVDPKAA